MAQRPISALQAQYISADARHVLGDGGYGSGKSQALCYKLYIRAMHPGAREGLFRKTLTSLKKSTLKTLLEGNGGAPPVIPEGTYDHLKSECEIKIHGGGSILYCGLDEPTRVRSMNLTGGAIDEADEITIDDYRVVESRCRVEIDGIGNQIYSACNPGPPSHHLAERFGLAMGHQPQPNTFRVRMPTDANPFLPADYIESQKQSLGVGSLAYKRFFLGEWCGSDDVVYDQWLRETHVMAREGPWARRVLAIDEGYTNPFVILDLCVDGDGRAHVAREYYATQVVREEKLAAVLGLFGGHDTVVVDPSAAELIADLRRKNIPVREADNAVFDGIMRVQARLVQQGDGRPRLTVDGECTNTIREFEVYEWDRSPSMGIKDKPKKVNDHAMDALRYGIAEIDRNAVLDLSVSHAGVDPYPRPMLQSFAELRAADPDWGF